MSKFYHSVAVLLALIFSTNFVVAESELYIAIPSSERAINDLHKVLDLTSDKEQKQKSVLQDYFDLLLEGVDQSLPFKLDVLSSPEEARYRIFFPMTKKTKDFRDNLKGYEIKARRVRTQQKRELLYKLSGEYTGFLKYDLPYGIMARTLEDIDAVVTKAEAAIPADSEIDILLSMQNNGGDVAERHTEFGGIQKLIKSYFPRKEGETAEDFAVRESFHDLLISEAERVYAEASAMALQWQLPESVEHGNLSSSFNPIPKTSLAATVDSLKSRASQFAGIPDQTESILKIRILFPLDELRQKNLGSVTTSLKAAYTKLNAENENKTEDVKAAYASASDLLFDMVDKTVASGWLDTVVQVYDNDSGRVSIAAMNSADGNEARKILELIPKTAAGRAVEFGVDKQGDVEIHKVTFEKGGLDRFKGFFGENVEVFVGTSANSVWLAAGADAINELKSSITQATAAPAKPEAVNQFVDIQVAVAAWVDTLHTARGDRGNDKLHEMATSAFSEGADAVKFQLTQKENMVDGGLSIDQGVLRLAGKLIADFSKENLEE